MNINNDGATPKAPIPNDTLEARVAKRFGLLPNFFRANSQTTEIGEHLWVFAQATYLDNPLPSAFKERLFVHLSRFCEVRYCIARHVGFLVGLGYTAGDAHCPSHTVEDVVRLLERPVERGDDLRSLISLHADQHILEELPNADSQTEGAIFSFASHVFLQTTDAPACLEVLRNLLGPVRFEYLLLLLVFVRSAHYWTELHPALALEDDIQHLLTVNQALAACVLRESEAGKYEVKKRLLDELAFLRQHTEQTERLRNLTSRMFQVQDQERRRIARELHDSTGQTLALLNMKLSQLMNRVSDNAELRESVEGCFTLASETSDQLRTVSYLLHPPLLDETGLGVALSELAEGFEKRSGIAVAVDLPCDFERLPEDVEIVLFRIVQEALTNVHKHAHADRIGIRISCNQDRLSLDIEDNGTGMTPEQIAALQKQTGVGIAGMRERLRPFGGLLDIQSNGKGTKFTVALPISSNTNSAQTKVAAC